MASLAGVLSSPTVSSVITSIASTLAQSLLRMAGKNFVKGLCLPINQDIIQQLASNDVVFYNIDKEVQADLVDEKIDSLFGSTISSISAYKSAKKIVETVLEISGSSKSQIVLISKDYHLLKHCECKSPIFYCLPSSELLEEIKKKDPSFDQITYDKIKNDLIVHKNGKIHIYSSIQELKQLLIDTYGVSYKI